MILGPFKERQIYNDNIKLQEGKTKLFNKTYQKNHSLIDLKPTRADKVPSLVVCEAK